MKNKLDDEPNVATCDAMERGASNKLIINFYQILVPNMTN